MFCNIDLICIYLTHFSQITSSVVFRAQCSYAVAKVLALHVSGYHLGTNLILAALLSIQLTANGLENQLKMAQSLGTLHSCGRFERGSRHLASDGQSSGQCGHLESGSMNGRASSLSLLLSVNLIVQEK